jgi:hypothetical protein
MAVSLDGSFDGGDPVEHLVQHGDLLSVHHPLDADISRDRLPLGEARVRTSVRDGELGLRLGQFRVQPGGQVRCGARDAVDEFRVHATNIDPARELVAKPAKTSVASVRSAAERAAPHPVDHSTHSAMKMLVSPLVLL